MKFIVGLFLFLVLLGTGVLAFVWTQSTEMLPSKEAVLDFAGALQEDSTTSSDTMTGSMVPDSSASVAASREGTPTTFPAEADTSASTDWLTPSQRSFLQAMGIDEASLPRTLTPELEACFVLAIGQVRVDAIKGGATPSVFEGMKAVSCL